MTMSGYWAKLTQARLNRRRALAGAAGGAVALSLVGCGGGSDSSSDPGGTGSAVKDSSGLLTPKLDRTAEAKQGGTWKTLTTADVTSFDPLSSQSYTTQVMAGWVYSRLLKIIPGYLKTSTGDVEGDLAESWEVSPDKTQITFKLRQNVKWDARTPTSSRPVSAEDVVFSWDKFASVFPYRTDLANVASKDAPIESMSAPDANTVVVKLAFPDASVISMLASSAHLYIMPQESEGAFNAKGEARGSGPWTLSDYRSSQSFTYTRNANWYRNDRPFFDKAEIPIVPEYASGLAQFRAGNIYSFAVKQDDLLQTKRDIPDLLMYQSNFDRYWYNSWFGYDGNSPFKDERVRQAWALSYDRDLWIQTIYATEQYTKIGLPVETRWHSHFPGGLEGWWVNPQDEKAFGPNAQYLQYDPQKAKQLLTAAGFANGLEVPVAHISTFQYLAQFPNQAQIQVGFANDVGFKTRVSNPDYQTDWLPKYYYSKGGFQGVAIGADNPEPDPGIFMFARFHPNGARFKGFSPDGSDPKKGDPKVTEFINAIRLEFDTTKRKEIAKQYQQYMAKAMYAVPFPGTAAAFALSWPCIGNSGVYNVGSSYGHGTESYVNLWLDTARAPIGKV